MHRIWTEVDFMVVDLETTGTTTTKPGICEVGAVMLSRGALDANVAYSAVVNPEGERITPHAWVTHRIPKWRMLQASPFDKIASEVSVIIGGQMLIVHNGRDDLARLLRGIPDLLPPLVLDSCKLAEGLGYKKKEKGLQRLVETLGLKHQIDCDYRVEIGRKPYFHTAYYDAIAAGHVFVSLMRQHKLSGASLGELKRLCGIV